MNNESKPFAINASSLRAYTILIALAVIWAFFYYATNGVFLTPRNLSNLSLQTATTGILAVGMLMVIVAGQIDLSVGSVLALAGGASAIAFTNYNAGFVPAVLIAVFVSLLIGTLQGSLVAYLKIPAFIVTLGGLLVWRGAIKGITKGETIPVNNPVYNSVGQSYIPSSIGWTLAVVAILAIIWFSFQKYRSDRKSGNEQTGLTIILPAIILPIFGILTFTAVMNYYAGVPIAVLILIAVAITGAFVTNNTVFGRYLYAMGGNADAARLSGINIKRNIVYVYALLGVLTGIAAVINVARGASAGPDDGTLLELDAIAACVIGGASLVGGRGTIFGACLGALIMTSLDNGMSLLNVSDFLQDVIKGSILVLAVGFDMAGRKTN
ncbi:MAG: sugar ABC transporter permease [Pyrinomonadaceae bacterium]|nr:sugar ABC transporter permease [Pyrinomonadaceae bacterium]